MEIMSYKERERVNRVTWYRENLPVWWKQYTVRVEGMLKDPLVKEDLKDLCWDFFGMTVEGVTDLLEGGFCGEPKSGESLGTSMSPGEVSRELEKKGPLSPAEKMRAYRERKKKERG
jgi:hypothetical protein